MVYDSLLVDIFLLSQFLDDFQELILSAPVAWVIEKSGILAHAGYIDIGHHDTHYAI